MSGHAKSNDAAATMRGRYDGLDLELVKPMTYMNESGIAVRKILARERAPLEDLLIVYDDFDLPLGKLRMREAGSAGTHNGMRSIVGELGTQKFARLRVGIGQPSRGAIGHVLTKFTPAERKVLDEVIDAAADAVEDWAREGANRAANTLERLDASMREQPTDNEATDSTCRSQLPPKLPPTDRRSSAPPPAGESCSTVADQTSHSVRIRGRTTRERRVAEQAATQVAERAAARAAEAETATTGTQRARLPNLSALTNLLATGGDIAALVERYRTVKKVASAKTCAMSRMRRCRTAQSRFWPRRWHCQRRAHPLDCARLGDRRPSRRGTSGMARRSGRSRTLEPEHRWRTNGVS